MKILYKAAMLTALGGLLSGFDTGVISGALLFLEEKWQLNSFAQGALVSIALLGAIIGSVSVGRFADIFGRKKIILFTAIIFLIGSILSGISFNVISLMISRFIVGFAIGVITFASPLYLSEISPKKIRGALVSMFQLAITLGILFSYLSNAFFANFSNWRMMLFIGVIPALILLIGMFFVPDTPRWYVLSGNIEKGRGTLLKFQPECDIDFEIKNIQSLVSAKEKKFEFKKWMLFPLFIGIGAMFIQQWTGINTIIYYAPIILKRAGFGDNISAIYATIGIGVVNFLMTFAAIFLSDKIGRKPLLYIGLSGMGFCLMLLALSFNSVFGDYSKYFALLSSLFYIMFFASSLGPVMILLVSEIFPVSARGVLMSISMMSNFIFNFILSLLFLPLLNFAGEYNTFILFSAISFLSIIFIRFIIPETKNISLEEIEKKFKNYV